MHQKEFSFYIGQAKIAYPIMENKDPKKFIEPVLSPFTKDVTGGVHDMSEVHEKQSNLKELQKLNEVIIPDEIMVALMESVKAKSSIVITFEKPILEKSGHFPDFKISTANVNPDVMLDALLLIHDILSGRIGGSFNRNDNHK